MGNFFSNEETFEPNVENNLRKLAGGNSNLSHFSEMTHNELTELSSATSDINTTQQYEMNNSTELSLNTHVLNEILNSDNEQRGGGNSDSDSDILVSTSNTPLDSERSDINDLMQLGGNSDSESESGGSISISSI